MADQGAEHVVDQLRAIERAARRSGWLSASSSLTNGLVCVGLGGTQGAGVLLVGLETVRAVGVAVALTLLVITLGLAGFSWVRRRAARPGWRRAVGKAEMVACLLLLSCETLRDGPHVIGPVPAVWVPWALATGAPLVTLGVREATRPRPPSPD